jgi:hypothetical protein
MAKQIRLDQNDFDLVQEAVLYMGKRFFAPGDVMALTEIEEKLDGLRRQGLGAESPGLMLSATQYDVFSRAMSAYADELNHPASDPSNRARSRRLQALALKPKPLAILVSQIRNWLTGS